MTESPFMTDGPAFERRAFERGRDELAASPAGELDDGLAGGQLAGDHELEEEDELGEEDELEEEEELEEDDLEEDDLEEEGLDDNELDDDELDDDELDEEDELGDELDDDELDDDEETDGELDEDELEEGAALDEADFAGNLVGPRVRGGGTGRRDDPAGEGFGSPGNRAEGGSARAVLEHIARSIVDDPEAVVVEVAPARSGVKLSLHVAPEDMGRIIGRRGRVAQALRTVVRAAAASEGGDAVVDIVD
jgi:predicted RNA-binding protein YlqC (UPF0109 family)